MNELCGDAVFVFTLLVRGCARCCSLLSLPSTFIALPTMESRPGFVPTHLPFSCFPFAWLRRVWCPPWVDRVPRAEFPMPRVGRRSRNSRARFGCHVTIGLGLGALHRLLQLALSRTPLGSRVLVSSRALASQMECSQRSVHKVYSQLSSSPALR